MTNHPASSRHERWWLVGILLAAAFVRLAAIHALDMPDRYALDASGLLRIDGVGGDELEYEGRAWNLVSGGDFWSVDGDSGAPPAFILWIGGIYAVVGRAVYVALLGNLLFGAAASLATFHLARCVLSSSWALVAASAVAIDPQLVYWSTRLLTESPAVAWSPVLGVLAWRAAQPRASPWRSVSIGAALGVSLSLRYNFLALFAAHQVWTVLDRSRTARWSRLAGSTFGFLVVVVPLVLVLRSAPAPQPHRFTPAHKSSTGLLGTAHYKNVAIDRAIRAVGRRLTPDETASVLADAEVYLAERPVWLVMLRNWTHEFSQFWRIVPTFGSPTEKFVFTAQSVLLFALSLAGALTLMRRREGASFVLLAALIVAGLTSLHVLILARPRYRLILEPYLWVLATVAIARFAEALRDRRGQTSPFDPRS